jgi:capsular polysaccharide transport system permease protein
MQSSLAIQLRVLHALIMREVLTRYGRNNIGFLWLIVEPMLFTLGVTALWLAFRPIYGSSLSVAAFAITGYCSVLLWRNCANRCALAILPNRSLLHHRNVKVLDLFMARLALEIAGATVAMLVLSVVFIAAGMMSLPEDIATMLGGWMILVLFSIGLGLLVGALTERSDVAERLWHPVSYFLFPVSGAVYMVEWLPSKLQETALLIPMVHGVEMMREGYFGAHVHAHYSVTYAVGVSLALILLGLALVRTAAYRVEQQ